MSFYCISVLSGMEEKYRESAQSIVDASDELDGTVHLLKKRMRLKNGKEYSDLFFPGYVFFETDEDDSLHLMALSECKGFIRYLPSNSAIAPLANADLAIVSTILKFGSTVSILPVTFDKDDRIVITDGPFKDFSGKVVAVNKRNKRVNIQLDFMSGMRVVGLSYEVVQKVLCGDEGMEKSEDFFKTIEKG